MAQRVGRGIALIFHDRGTRRGWVVSSTPWSHFTPGKDRYPFYRRLGEPQGRSGWAENLVPTGIRSRAVQPLVSRYTDWATRLTNSEWCRAKIIRKTIDLRWWWWWWWWRRRRGWWWWRWWWWRRCWMHKCILLRSPGCMVHLWFFMNGFHHTDCIRHTVLLPPKHLSVCTCLHTCAKGKIEACVLLDI